MKTISVLIPTLGRDDVLIDTLKALLSQTRLPDEVVIADQNDPPLPKVQEFIRELETLHKFRIVHILNKKKGLVANYNVALMAATSRLVLFLDDDIIPDPKLIESHLENYLSYPSNLGGVAGRVEQPTGDQPPETIKVFGQYHRWSGTMVACFNASQRAEVQIAPGGNMSFERDVLLKVGGFDPGFEGNGYFFETDASLRVVEAGYRIVFDPRAQVKHLMAPRGGARVTDKAEHTYSYVKNGIRLYRRHSPAAGLPLFILKQGAYVLAKSAYNFDTRIASRGLLAIKNALIKR